ncbi:hypothetical protein [Rhizobium sp. WYCCWR 11146]|uniref:hypothetical protein n=1 Tax=Rhizobium sp. WYCCWR 11146 TaxID=2749833 RepID=UPI0015E6B582|nr:hypothetical protein [Rhizobium sp. WYCCWR 11146]MBA1345968.1 hypothetical protein [Rhizobium sp. WYCCWR 11146]
MSRRIRTAEESARRESAIAKSAMYTLLADSTAPRDPRMRGDHYRRHLVDAHRTIEILQLRITDLEQERDKIKQAREYDLSLCVTRTAAEDARQDAFRLARRKAAILAEWPHGVPTMLSEEIDCIPDPKPKWSK